MGGVVFWAIKYDNEATMIMKQIAELNESKNEFYKIKSKL